MILTLITTMGTEVGGNPTQNEALQYEVALKKENLPIFDPKTLYVIHYTTTKDLSNGALKRSLLLDLKQIFNIDLFVESGTCWGHTTAVAATVFSEVHSIEILPELYSKAQKRFANVENVFLHLGDSGTVLNNLISFFDKKILFYLDGHYDGGASGRGEKNTPIREELAAIKNANQLESVILIDDIADFQDSLYSEHVRNTCFEGYPNLKELVSELLKINPDYHICFLGNALLAFPPTPNVCGSLVLNACSMDILSTVDHQLFSNENLLEAETIIAFSSGQERAELINYYLTYAPFEQSYGWRSFSTFWYGLMLQKGGKPKEGMENFRAAAQCSLPGWRVDQYVPRYGSRR